MLLDIFLTNNNDTNSSHSKKPIRFGLRESIKTFKSDNTRLVAISDNLKPRYVVNRIILRAIAYNKGINIICLPNMDKLIQKLLGFTCFALTITENKMQEFDEIFNWCHEILIVSQETSSLNQSTFSEQGFKKCDGSEIEQVQNTNKLSYENDGLNFKQIYLSSGDNMLGQRVFHPVNSEHFKPMDLILEPIKQIRSDFIQVNKFDAKGSINIEPYVGRKRNQNKRTNNYAEKLIDIYQPLTLHKIQQNPQKMNVLEKN